MTQALSAIQKVEILEPLVTLEPDLLQACQELERAYRQLHPAESKGPFYIDSAELNAKAQQLQATAADLKKRLEAKKKEASEPYNAAIKTIREIVAGYAEPVEAVLSAVTPAMSKWYVEEQRRAREAQEKLNREIEAENARNAKRAEKKGAEPPPPVVAPVVAQPEKTVDLGDLKQTMRDNWALHLSGMTDEEAKKLRRSDARSKGIPDALFVFDWATASAQARGSKGVNPYEGTPIRFENEPVPANRK